MNIIWVSWNLLTVIPFSHSIGGGYVQFREGTWLWFDGIPLFAIVSREGGCFLLFDRTL